MIQVRRRRLLIGAGALLAVPLHSFAQQPSAKLARIGFLGLPSAAGWTKMVDALREGLRELGYVEGRNLAIEFRWAEGNYDRLPALAADLVRLKVDVIVTHATVGVRTAQQATATIPIVIAATGDAVETGLVASLAQPGGNVTGSSFLAPVLATKRLEMLKEAIPRIRRVGVLFNLRQGTRGSVDALGRAARQFKVELIEAGVRGPDELETALAGLARRRIDAVMINEDPMLVASAKDIADLAARRRLPTMGFAQIAEAGGLMAFGANIAEMHRRAAYFVDKILRGAKPGDLPIEQPTRFEMIVNLKTARALGLSIPKAVLLRADRVIE